MLNYLASGIQSSFCLKSGFLSEFEGFTVPNKIGRLSNCDDDQTDDVKKQFNDQNNNSARVSRFLVHFFDFHY